MTIIEAAAFGAPSVIASGSNVGASAIVGDGASIPIDFALANDDGDDLSVVRQALMDNLLANSNRLQEIGCVARERALSWDETAYGTSLLTYIREAIETYATRACYSDIGHC